MNTQYSLQMMCCGIVQLILYNLVNQCYYNKLIKKGGKRNKHYGLAKSKFLGYEH